MIRSKVLPSRRQQTGEGMGTANFASPLLTTGIHSLKKRFNADSPSFTPASLVANGNGAPAKTTGLSSRAASAAPFRPKNHTPGRLRSLIRRKRFSKVHSSQRCFSKFIFSKALQSKRSRLAGSRCPGLCSQLPQSLYSKYCSSLFDLFMQTPCVKRLATYAPLRSA